MVTVAKRRTARVLKQGKRVLRLGYVPLVDSAPLLVAEKEGLFRENDLEVRLSREPGWASIREKLIYGEVDAAQCLGGLAIALNLGIGCIAKRTYVPFVLNANGNAITFSNSVPREVVADGSSLKKYLKTRSERRPFTLATVHPFSSHHALLHQWLVQHDLKPGSDVNIIFLPPPIVPRILASGAIDGFCVGEPWNSQSILSGQGWCATTSTELADGHPEKVLAVSEELQVSRPDEVVALTAALKKACALCDDPGYRSNLITLLQTSANLGASRESIANSLGSRFRAELGDVGREVAGFHLFSGEAVNCPDADKANWIVSGMRRTGLLEQTRLTGISDIFRGDIYEAALKHSPTNN